MVTIFFVSLTVPKISREIHLHMFIQGGGQMGEVHYLDNWVLDLHWSYLRIKETLSRSKCGIALTSQCTSCNCKNSLLHLEKSSHTNIRWKDVILKILPETPGNNFNFSIFHWKFPNPLQNILFYVSILRKHPYWIISPEMYLSLRSSICCIPKWGKFHRKQSS